MSHGRLQSALRKTYREPRAITFYATKKKEKKNYNKAGIQWRSQAGFPSLLQVSGASGEELDTKDMNHRSNANLYMSKPHNYMLVRKCCSKCQRYEVKIATNVSTSETQSTFTRRASCNGKAEREEKNSEKGSQVKREKQRKTQSQES